MLCRLNHGSCFEVQYCFLLMPERANSGALLCIYEEKSALFSAVQWRRLSSGFVFAVNVGSSVSLCRTGAGTGVPSFC